MVNKLILLITLTLVTCQFWENKLNYLSDEDDIPTPEELTKILNIDYQSNDITEEFLGQMTSNSPFLFDNEEKIPNTCAERKDFSGPDLFQFFPQTKAIIHNEKETFEFTNDCFKTNKVSMTMDKSKGTVVVNIVSSDPTSKFCKDSYLLSTSRHFKVKIAFMKGEHKITFKGLNEDDMIEIAVNGIRVFGFCESISESVVSIYKTIKFFIESKSHNHDEVQRKIPFYKGKSQAQVELDHMNFLHKFSRVEIQDRGKYGDIVLPIEDSIQSGDFIGLTEIDSLVSTLIMYMSGGRISHAAIALRLENNKLYVAEMKGKGLFLSTWKEFVDEQIFTHHYVVHCPLKEKYRKMFNTQKALAYYKSLGNMKYGDYNLLFPWFDDPKKATANYVPVENFLLFGSLVEKIDKSIINKNLGTGLNMRLGTSKLTFSQITIEAAKRNMSFEELFAVPEDDNWRYDNGENVICSSFVAAAYRHAGLFEGVDFNTKEMQPKDIYLLDFFETDPMKRHPLCNESDPNLPYCQIMGKYRLILDNYSTISPYAHMFEKCPTLPPFYEIYPGC